MFRTLAPPPDLKPYVRFFWSLQGAAAPRPERVIPDGCCELIFHVGDAFRRIAGCEPATSQPDAFVYGQIEHAIQLQSTGAIDVIGVRLAPAGVAALWGMDASALGPRECALADLFPVRLRLSSDELRDLVGEPTPACDAQTQQLVARCARIARWLRGRSHRSQRPQVRRAMAALACMAQGDADLAAIARSIGASRRSMERAFGVAVGLSPAAYLRLRRIDQCGRELRRGVVRLSAIAAQAGYADQAHFSREFRQIVGVTPAAYRLEQQLHTPLLP